MTARQEEIQTVEIAVAMCKKLVADSKQKYTQALADVESGVLDADSTAPAFYREELAHAKDWLAKEKSRLAVLLAQEVGK